MLRKRLLFVFLCPCIGYVKSRGHASLHSTEQCEMIARQFKTENLVIISSLKTPKNFLFCFLTLHPDSCLEEFRNWDTVFI